MLFRLSHEIAYRDFFKCAFNRLIQIIKGRYAHSCLNIGRCFGNCSLSIFKQGGLNSREYIIYAYVSGFS